MNDRNDPRAREYRHLGLVLLAEGGLGLAALGIGWLAGHWPAIGIRWEAATAGEQLRAAGAGVLATLPLLAMLLAADRFPIGPLKQVQDVATEAIRQMFPRPRVWHLALVAGMAGIGEELLFRGLVQAGLAEKIGPPYGAWAALAVASVMFGAFHWLNTTYALLAALAGAYFGWLLIATGSLWPPIVAHAIYDFVALCYLVRSNKMVGLNV
jgi:membrane protease YdiL (CAAX protease family)